MIRQIIIAFKRGLILKVSIIILIIFLVFLLFNGTDRIYVPYSIFPKEIDIKLDGDKLEDEKDILKRSRENFFNNKDYDLHPLWSVGKYRQETNNILSK